MADAYDLLYLEFRSQMQACERMRAEDRALMRAMFLTVAWTWLGELFAPHPTMLPSGVLRIVAEYYTDFHDCMNRAIHRLLGTGDRIVWENLRPSQLIHADPVWRLPGSLFDFPFRDAVILPRRTFAAYDRAAYHFHLQDTSRACYLLSDNACTFVLQLCPGCSVPLEPRLRKLYRNVIAARKARGLQPPLVIIFGPAHPQNKLTAAYMFEDCVKRFVWA